MRTTRTRHQFYLPDDLSEMLDRLAAKPGASKTAILTDALRAWIARSAGHELDQRFGPRLDRQSKATGRIEARLEMVAETLDLFIQHHLTQTARNPPIDHATGQLGLKRYGQFTEHLSLRLARRRSEALPASVPQFTGEDR